MSSAGGRAGRQAPSFLAAATATLRPPHGQTLRKKGVKKNVFGLFPLSAERKLDITCEEQEEAADCTGRGREVFNLEASVVFKPSASWGVNQHLGYR